MLSLKTQTNSTFSNLMLTTALLIFVPLLIIGCAWLIRHPPTLLLGNVLAIFIIWIICSGRKFSLGVFVGFTAFLFLIHSGTALHYLTMEKSGDQQIATIVEIKDYSNYQSYDRDCILVKTDNKPVRFPLTETTGCWGNPKKGQQILIYEDPSQWFPPITVDKVKSLTTRKLWIAVGIGIWMELLIIYNRFDIRRRLYNI